ncbi:hypothetical protein M9458_000766, partial [Cirrhinus mrigala]
VGKYVTRHLTSLYNLDYFIKRTSSFCTILGHPWLRLHRPELRWDPCDITRWSPMCHTQCLSKLPHPPSVPALVASTHVESSEPAFTPNVPAEYMAFQDVFSTQAATHLPPRRPWDCAIDLLPGAQLPKGKVYPLSIPERQAMEDYSEEVLNQGFIKLQASSSWARRMEVFARALTTGNSTPRSCNSLILSPCFVDAYKLVRIRAGDEWKTAFVTPTGHYEYQVMLYGLSISPSVFQTFMNEVFREFLHRFVLKCEFHKPSVQFLGYIISAKGIKMDQGKVKAIQDWPQPNRFSNFYRCFIKDYSFITTLLTSLLRGKPKHLTWSPAVHEAFQHLKRIFSTAPLLHHPDPELLFTVEVDASTTGVGVVLSQVVGEPPVLHPCAFYSCKLSLAEQNYDVGNRELLAIKLALEEWCHWLEGAVHHFIIIIYVPRSQRQTLLGTAHQSPGSGHPGPAWKVTLDCIEIVSDRGPQFISHVWKAFFKLLGVTVNLSSGYHPQTNGQTERKIQELGRYLRAYCHEDQHSWSRFLPWAEYAQNSLRQDTTGLTPFQCVLGYQPPLFAWTEEPSNVPAVDHWFRENERVWDSAHHHLQRAVCRSKHFADARPRIAPRYQPGDQVWLSTRDIRLRLPSRKLSPCYIGPFKILRQINDVTFQLQLPPRYRIYPTFHVSLLKPFFPSATETPGAEAGPPPPEVLDQPSIYMVHKILDSQRQGGHLEYLIDWEGYGPEKRSWVPRDDVLDPTLLAEFHWDHPDHPPPCGRGRPRRRVGASVAAPGGGVVSDIHHSHPHLPRHLEHRPPVPHHRNSNHVHLFSISHTPYKKLSSHSSLVGSTVCTAFRSS